MNGKPSLKGAWLGNVNYLKFDGHQPYLWNGWSSQVLSTRWTVSVVNWWRSRSPVYHTDRRHLCVTRWACVTASRGSVSGKGDLFCVCLYLNGLLTILVIGINHKVCVRLPNYHVMVLCCRCASLHPAE